MDWNFLLFFGVILSATSLVGGLGLDRSLAGGLGGNLARLGVGPVGFVAILVVVGALLELVLAADRSFMMQGVADGKAPASLRLTGMNFGPLAMCNDLSRLEARLSMNQRWSKRGTQARALAGDPRKYSAACSSISPAARIVTAPGPAKASM